MKKALIIFFIFWYLIPGLFTLIYPKFITDLFKGNVYFTSIIYSFIFLLLTIYFSKLNINFKGIKQFKFLGLLYNSKIEYLFVILFFFSSIYFIIEYGFSFRQTGDNMSTAGSLLYLNYVTKAYIKCFIFKQVILTSYSNYKLPILKLTLVLIGSILSTAAALDAMLPLTILVLLLRKDMIYNEQHKSSFLFYSILFVLLFSIPIIGTANKVGFEQTYYIFTETSEFFAKSLFRRIATWHHSVNIYIDIVYNEIIPNRIDLISDIFKTSINRVYILFGGERSIPEIHTAARYNYLNLFHDTGNPKTGATSGVIATSLLFFPFGLFLFSFLVSRYYKFIYELIPKKTSNFTHFFILMVIILPLISSPLDLIILVSPEIFFLFFLISLKYKLKFYAKKNTSYL